MSAARSPGSRTADSCSFAWSKTALGELGRRGCVPDGSAIAVPETWQGRRPEAKPGPGRETYGPVRACGNVADASVARASWTTTFSTGTTASRSRPVARFRVRHRPHLQLRIPRLALRGQGFRAPRISRTRRHSTLAGRDSSLIAVGEVVGAKDRAAADLHLPCQPVETGPCLPAAIDLRCDFPIRRLEWLA